MEKLFEKSYKFCIYCKNYSTLTKSKKIIAFCKLHKRKISDPYKESCDKFEFRKEGHYNL